VTSAPPALLLAVLDGGSRLVGWHPLRDGVALVVTRPPWSDDEHPGLDVRRWQCDSAGAWSPTRAGLFVPADALAWLGEQLEAGRDPS
jgi:hypothetical protein